MKVSDAPPRGGSCVLCESPLEQFTSGDGFTPATWRCISCKLVQLRFKGGLDRSAWQRLYSEPGRYHKDFVLRGFASFDERLAHDLRLARVRLENLCRFAPQARGRLLDVGCSNGALMTLAANYGFIPFGIDPDEWVIAEACKRNAYLHALQGTFETVAVRIKEGNFQVVAFIDSFEHLPGPHEALREVRRILAPGGLLVIEGPDADCPAFREEGADWKHFKPMEHAFLWGRRHMELLLSRRGFNLVDTIVPYPDRRVYYARCSHHRSETRAP